MQERRIPRRCACCYDRAVNGAALTTETRATETGERATRRSMKSMIIVLGVGFFAACVSSPRSAPAPHAVVAAPPDAGHAPAISAKSEAPIEVALTFDDLPSRDFFANATRLSVLQRIMSAQKSHALGPMPGFVNGSFAPTDVDRAALDAWLEGGNQLGNHTYSHADLRTMGLGEYLSDNGGGAANEEVAPRAAAAEAATAWPLSS